MVSAAVSKLGCTNLIFVESGAKMNRYVLLVQELMAELSTASLRTCLSSSKTMHHHIATFFRFPKVKRPQLTGKAGKFISFSCQTFSVFQVPNIIKIG